MKCATLLGVALVAVLELGLPRSANARGAAKSERLSVTLEYDVPSNCPAEEAFKTIVVKRLGRDPFAPQAPNRVSTLVSASNDTLSGRLVWRDDAGKWTGEQLFPSRTNHCEQLIAAMGFALAVQIQLLDVEDDAELETDSDATSATETLSAAPPEPPNKTKSSAPAENPKNSAPPPEHHEVPLRFSIGGGGAIAVGMSSQIVPVGRLFVDLRSTFAAVEAGLEVSLPVVTRRADGAGFSQSYLLATVAGCGVAEPWNICAVLKGGMVRAAGQRIDVPNSANAALVQSGLRLGWTQGLSSRIFLALRAEALVNLTRWSVELDQVSEWNAPRFAFGSGLDFLVLLR